MNLFWWLVGTFGVAGVVLGAAVLVFGWPVVIGTKVGRLALALGAGVLALFGVYTKGRLAGEARQRAKQEKDNAAFLENKRRRDAGLDELSDDELDKLLRDKRGK